MKTVNARAIRNTFPQVLRSLKAGERAVITSRGKVVGTFTKAPKPYEPEQFLGRVEAAYSDEERKRLAGVDVARFLDETR